MYIYIVKCGAAVPHARYTAPPVLEFKIRGVLENEQFQFSSVI